MQNEPAPIELPSLKRQYVTLERDEVLIYPDQRPVKVDPGTLALPEWARVGLAVGVFVATGDVSGACATYLITGEGGPSGAPNNPSQIVQTSVVPSAEEIAEILKVQARITLLQNLQIALSAITLDMSDYVSLTDPHKAEFVREALPRLNSALATAEALHPEGTGAYWIVVSVKQALLLDGIRLGVIQLPNWRRQTLEMETAFDRSITSCRNSLFRRYSPSPSFPTNHLPLSRRQNGDYFYNRDGTERDSHPDAPVLRFRMRQDFGREDFRGLSTLADGVWDLTKAQSTRGRFVRIRETGSSKSFEALENGLYGFFGDETSVVYMIQDGKDVLFQDSRRLFITHDDEAFNLLIPGTNVDSQAERFELVSAGSSVKIKSKDGRFWGSRFGYVQLVDEVGAFSLSIEDADYSHPNTLQSNEIISQYE